MSHATRPLGETVHAVGVGLAELAAVDIDRQAPADLDRVIGNEVCRFSLAAESNSSM
jgi:hypothetical protein